MTQIEIIQTIILSAPLSIGIMISFFLHITGKDKIAMILQFFFLGLAVIINAKFFVFMASLGSIEQIKEINIQYLIYSIQGMGFMLILTAGILCCKYIKIANV